MKSQNQILVFKVLNYSKIEIIVVKIYLITLEPYNESEIENSQKIIAFIGILQ